MSRLHDRPHQIAPDGAIEIGIAQLDVSTAPGRIRTPALGSCVAVSIYDSFARRGGLAHVMLPTAGDEHYGEDLVGRFADTAVPELVRRLSEQGSLRRRMEAKIAGGAAMFKGESPIAKIGDRNVAEVKRQLVLMSIPLVAEDTGEAHARTVELVLDTGEFLVRSYQFGLVKL